MELDAIYCAVTIIQIIQIEVSHLELFKCPFEYSSAIQIWASRQQKTTSQQIELEHDEM